MSSPRRGSIARRGGGAATGTSARAVELRTLGGVRLLREGADETSKLGARHLALLIYLYQERRPLHPAEVIELLGRGRDEEEEVEGLRRAVAQIKKKVPGVNIRISEDTVEAIGGLQLDTRQVDTAIDGGDPRRVAELYTGSFLAGFQSGSPAFDEWAAKEQARLHRAWGNAAKSAAKRAERGRDFETATQWWQVLVTRAPTDSEGVAGLMGCFSSCGQESEAAKVYAGYIAQLGPNGSTGPSDEITNVLAEFPKLGKLTGGMKPPPRPRPRRRRMRRPQHLQRR